MACMSRMSVPRTTVLKVAGATDGPFTRRRGVRACGGLNGSLVVPTRPRGQEPSLHFTAYAPWGPFFFSPALLINY